MKKFIIRSSEFGVRSFLFFIFCFLLAPNSQLLTPNCYAEPFYIDHFEKQVNVLGGRTSVYQQAPSRAAVSTTDREHFGPAGKCLAIRYDKKNTGGPYGGGGWCGYYSLLKVGSKYLNGSGFKALTFWVKGEKGGENFKIGVADRNWEQLGDSVKSEEIGVYLSPKNEVTTEWQKAVIPLDTFFIDVNELASLAISFEGDCFPDGQGKGVIYIDELAFE